MEKCKWCGEPISKDNIVNAWQHTTMNKWGLRFYCVMSGGVVLREIEPAEEEPEDLPLQTGSTNPRE